jgi:hypothetical protein
VSEPLSFLSLYSLPSLPTSLSLSLSPLSPPLSDRVLLCLTLVILLLPQVLVLQAYTAAPRS